MLPITARRLREELRALVAEGLVDPASRAHFVDDGSSDDTWRQIADLAESGPFHGIRLTRNFGHQHALYAGLMEADGDVLISLDADLQDDVDVIRQMLAAYAAGSEIVYGVRDDRSTDTRFKRLTAAAHYSLSTRIGIKTIRNHADYRLMSRRAVEMLRQYRETNLYLRGIVPLIGLDTAVVYCRRDRRAAGVSKYSLRRMLGLSLNGLTSFSILPLRVIAAMGFLICLVSVLLGAWALWAVLFDPATVPGWASTVIPLYLLGGLQLLSIGVVGEYIGKSYMEAKRRPLYIVESTTGEDDPAPGGRDA